MYNPCVLCISETRLKSTHVLRSINKYRMRRKDADLCLSGRGVAILVSNVLNDKLITLNQSICSENIEVLCYQVQLNFNKSLLVCCVYRHPAYDANCLTNDYEAFYHLFVDLLSHNKPVFLLGDFNLRGKYFDRLNAILRKLNLTQLIHEPTRGENTLDLIITNANHLVSNTNVLDLNLSDHAYVECSLNLSRPKQQKQLIKYRNFKNINPEILLSELEDFDNIDLNSVNPLLQLTSKLNSLFNKIKC